MVLSGLISRVEAKKDFHLAAFFVEHASAAFHLRTLEMQQRMQQQTQQRSGQKERVSDTRTERGSTRRK